jgi:tetratricopeptide (TPR) repeat protein
MIESLSHRAARQPAQGERRTANDERRGGRSPFALARSPGTAPRSALRAAVALSFFLVPCSFVALGAARGGDGPARFAMEELQLTGAEFKMLDAAEAQALSSGDKAFAQKDYRRAVAEYESFLLEFGRSRAVPYALFRKARSFQLDNKRLEAVRTFKEVLGYFPNHIGYAAPAAYLIGVCHQENGDTEKAIKAWSDMVADLGYRRHPLAADALAQMADELMQRGSADRALAYYEQLAEEFRTANPGAAKHGIERAAGVHMVNLNEPRLRSLYERVKTFGSAPGKVVSPASQDSDYWYAVHALVGRHGRFPPEKDDARSQYYRYWSGLLDGKSPEDDGYQLALAGYHRIWEKDDRKWFERVDRQFQRNFKPGDFGRVIRWMNIYSSIKSKVQEYYGKLDFAQMKNPQIETVMLFMYDTLKDADLGLNVFHKLRCDVMDDGDKERLARYFFGRDEHVVKDLVAAMSDKTRQKLVLLDYFLAQKDYKAALALADELALLPDYAKMALRCKAGIFEALQEWNKAIMMYRMLDEPPGTLYSIVNCLLKMGKLDEAVGQLREIESFFKDQSSSAAYRIARVFRDFGQQPKYVAQLRYIMKSYPKSRESSSAHIELEKLGFKIGGGVDSE